MQRLNIGTTAAGKNFSLPLEVVTTSLAVLAKKRVGKSYLSDVIAEELMAAAQPTVIIDITGAHWGLKSTADGKGDGFPIVIFGGRHADVPLEENAGKVVAAAIVEKRFSAILDFSVMSKAGMKRFLLAFMEELYRLNELPIHLICDECDRYAPQKPDGDDAKLIAAMDDIVSRGGIKGIGVSLITQRSAKLNKNILTQCELLVVLRIIHPLDAKAVMEWVEMHATEEEAKAMLESLPTLPVGTGWFWWPDAGDNDLFERVKIRARRTFDSGATPKAGAVRQQPKHLAQVDVEQLGADIGATVQRAKDNDPAALKARIRELEAAAKRTPVVSPEVKIERVEVPVFDKEAIEKIKGRLNIMDALVHEFKTNVVPTFAQFERVSLEIKSGVDGLISRQLSIARTALPSRPRQPRQPRIESTRLSGGAGDPSLPKGERAVLIVCAQYDGGATREQLTVLTGYKRSSRDAYLQRLREKKFIEDTGESIQATADGVAALGDFEALPVGDALRDYWMKRLPEGERRVLEIVCAGHPDAIERQVIDEKTGYQRSSRDAYLQRLGARQLIKANGRGHVIASENLFS